MKNKIQVMKTCHKVESTAANQHNIILDEKEVQKMQQKENICNQNIIEWYIRTLGDEIYKLSFIDDQIYYRIKLFWPQQYQDYKKTQKDSDVEYFLEPFKSFDLEDYFDILIFPTILSDKIELRIALNIFTFQLQNDQLKEEKLIEDIKGLELFYDHSDSSNIIQNSNETLIDFTKLLLKKYIFKPNNQQLQTQGLQINSEILKERLKAIMDEETRLVLFELYVDL